MNDAREANLPKWAQELICELRKRVQYGNEPLLKELSTLRPLVASIKAKNDALNELLQAAAKGGHITAREILEVIETYAPWKEEFNK